MKILVSTNQTQGQRPSDFCWTREGEVVFAGVVCDCDPENPDGGCGCQRSLTGIESRKGTTTARVKVIPPGLPALAALIKDSETKAWGHCSQYQANKIAAAIRRAAEKFNEGDVVEFRSGEFSQRVPTV